MAELKSEFRSSAGSRLLPAVLTAHLRAGVRILVSRGRERELNSHGDANTRQLRSSLPAGWQSWNLLLPCAPSSALTPCRPTASGALSLSHTLFSFLFCHAGSTCPTACGVSAPWPGIKPTCPALEGRFVTPGPPGNSPTCSYANMGFKLWFCFVFSFF